MAQKSKLLVAEFPTTKAIVTAAAKVSDAGYRYFDAHTPFPVHGLDKAMKLPGSKLGWIVLAHGIVGGAGGYAMQAWMTAVDYPTIVGGKPYVSLPAFVPIVFALTILLSCFGAVLGMLFLNGLPRLSHPLLAHGRFRGFSDDRFYLSIESDDPLFDPGKTRAFLEQIGGQHIALLEAP